MSVNKLGIILFSNFLILATAPKEAYLKAFWKNFNWTAANDLFKRASTIRL